MAKSLEPLEKLGRTVASALDAAAAQRASAVEQARQAFISRELGSRSRKSLHWNAASTWGTGLAVVLAAAVLVVFTQRGKAITFAVDGAPGAAKTWLAAPADNAVQLAFSEGSNLRLEAASRARITDIDAHGASVSLESGRLHAEVVHRAGSAWKVVAGPYTVVVTGTVFDVNWDANREQLAVSVARGSVSVREVDTGVEQAVHAFETVRANSSEHRFELRKTPPSAEVPAAPALSAIANEAALAQPEVPPVASAAREATPQSSPPEEAPEPVPNNGARTTSDWRQYAKRGALREAFASADAAGFAASCSSASPAELLLLGDGARLSGKPDRAAEALLALRRRFPNDPRRAAAAFALGKVAFDQRHAYEQSAEWFSTSIREQPNGALAREASGRLIEALRRADDSAGARRAARDYLVRYPEGPHADLARSVLH